ncbi:hypothetical protein [Haloglomus litoreum]|uniref:hypothetical protein n=1 Tax=Haloglomus litoreum TaxID=3034026 RepID=UPI0023E8361C|nr:hypothetical protein [Haloglomus sp. DT116]
MVFEDKEENLWDLVNPLEEDLDPDEFYVENFTGDRSANEDESDVDFVMRILEEEDYPVLVVLDAELNQYIESTVRKSDVKDACLELGVPLCVYHRDEGEYSDPENIKESEDHLIKLDPKEGHEQMAESCAILAKGFNEIQEKLKERLADADPEDLLEPPSEFMKDITDVPVSAKANLDKYSWGQSESVAILKEGGDKQDSIRRKSTVLGYWIHNQLLEYPGVLLNPVAAASYLGVNHEVFAEDEEYHEPLEEALYQGPFSGLDNWWWKAEIDGLLNRNTTPEDGSVISGREFLSREGYDIGPVQCLEGHDGAGYYCILTGEPVCEDDSVSPEAWIPAGASISRISEGEYMKLSGWD